MSEAQKKQVGDVVWHALDPEEALSRLESNEDGLADGEVRRRQASWGPNALPEEDRPGALRIFLRQFKDPLVYVLLIAALVSLGLGQYCQRILYRRGAADQCDRWRPAGGAC